MAQYIKTEDGYKGLEESISAVTDGKMYSKMDKTNPTGTGSFSMNRKAGTVIGTNSHAEGYNTTASGSYSHAEGNITTASGTGSHVEGRSTKASGDYSHAEGIGTEASGTGSHAEGNGTTASGNSHAEGTQTTASGSNSHAEGTQTTASGSNSHAEGNNTKASGFNSHAEGSNTKATSTDDSTSITFDPGKGYYTHAEGFGTVAYGRCSHAEGNGTKASGNDSHSEGYGTVAYGTCSHAEGDGTIASGTSSHAEGYKTTAHGNYSHAEGYSTNMFSSVVTTNRPTTDDIINVWKNKKFSVAKGHYSHVEGWDNLALDDYSHAEGYQTTASGTSSHAEGDNTTASKYCSHAEGYQTKASGRLSHAEGNGTTASGDNSHAEGFSTTANGNYSHVQGKYNIEDTSNKYADIIGNGTITARSNAATVDWSGNAWFAGDVYTGSTSGTNKDEGSKKLATEEYVNSSIAASGADISLGLTSASVGQIIKVKAIDESGKPTEWEAAEMASGDRWELIAHINVVDDVEKGVTVWEYNNLPRYKYIAYKKVSLVGSSDQTASGCTIMINGESSQPSGMTYGKNGSPQSCIGVICVMPFGWTHCKTADANTPNNIALGGVNAMLTALPLSDNAITSIKLSAHPTYKIVSGEIWLYGKKG